jgi:hypothetical protein
MASNPTTDRQPAPSSLARHAAPPSAASGESQGSSSPRTVEYSEYRKHSLEDILQNSENMSTKRAKASTSVSNAPQIGGGPSFSLDGKRVNHAQADYDMQLMLLAQQNQRRLMMVQEAAEKDRANVDDEKSNQANRESQKKPRKGGPSHDTLLQPPILDKESQNESSPLRPAPPASPHRQTESSRPAEKLSATEVIEAKIKAWDKINQEGQVFVHIVRKVEDVKFLIEQGLVQLPKTLHDVHSLKSSLPGEEETRQMQQSLLEDKKIEIDIIAAKYNDLIGMTPNAQKNELRQVRIKALSSLMEEYETI